MLFLLSCELVWPEFASAADLRIAVSPPRLTSSAVLRPSLADLRDDLQQMSGGQVTFDSDPQKAMLSLYLASASEAPKGAVERLAGKGLDSFVVIGDGKTAQIVANDDHGLSNGIAFYLEQLGVRWLLPSVKWTVVPRRSGLVLSIDRLVEPGFHVRSYAGTGGFYSWRWGRNFPGSATFEKDTTDWKRHLRYGGEYALGKSVGEAFIADRTIVPVLAQHPEYLAKIDGQFSPLYITDKTGKQVLNVTAKLNAGSPEAINLFCDWVVSQFKRSRQDSAGFRNEVASVEPSDGYGYGNDTTELPGNGSGSDQSFYIANQCAKQIRAFDPKASVILLAYAGHADLPSFALEPNVIVQVTPYAFQSRPPAQFIRDWSRKARRLAIYDYWSIPDWSWDEPTFDWQGIGTRLRNWRAAGIEAVNAETTYGAGAMGLGHYLAAHLMWDPSLNQRALEDDWFGSAFGPARNPIRQMFARWGKSFKLTSAELGASFGDLAAAERLAAGDPAVVARLDDLARYAQYLRLRLELLNATGPDAHAKARDIVTHLLSCDDSHMMHTTRLTDLYTREYPELTAGFDVNRQDDAESGWSAVRPLDHQDIERLIADGTRAYPLPDFASRTFDGPATPVNLLPPVRESTDAAQPVLPLVGNLTLRFLVTDGKRPLSFRFSQRSDLDVTVSDRANRVVATKHVQGAGQGAGTVMTAVEFDLDAGEYTMKVTPAGGRATGYFSFDPPRATPVAIEEFLSPKPTPSPRLFFYVPRGLDKLAISMPDSDFNGVFKFQVFDSTGKPVGIERRDNGRLLVASVPTGQDGAVWSLQRAVTPTQSLQLLNAPQAFALSQQAVLVPAGALAQH